MSVCFLHLCVSQYDPVGVAMAISRVPGIEQLSFAVDVAPSTGPFLNDNGLRAVAMNLNSSSLVGLHVFIGTLANITGNGLAAFTALNPTART